MSRIITRDSLNSVKQANSGTSNASVKLRVKRSVNLCSQIHSQLPAELPTRVALAMACYLVQEGCSLDKKNHKGATPLDCIANTPLAAVLRGYVTQRTCVRGNGGRHQPFIIWFRENK